MWNHVEMVRIDVVFVGFIWKPYESKSELPRLYVEFIWNAFESIWNPYEFILNAYEST